MQKEYHETSEKTTSKLNGNGQSAGFGASVREAVENEFEQPENGLPVIEHAEVFAEILENLPPNFDFAKEVGCPPDDVTVTQKRIITIEQVLKTAIDRNVGLCRSQDFLYGFNGAFWSLLDRDETTKLLVDAARKLGVQKYKAKDYKFADELYKQFARDAILPAPKATTDKVLINLENGTFEITETARKLRLWKRSDFIKYQLPFKYDESATCPKWKAFLNRVLPETDEQGQTVDKGKSRQKVLAEYIGYVFTRKPKLEQTLLCFGTGANGKSVFFDVVNALLGENNVSNYSLESLGENYFRAMLANKLLNYSSEISTRLQAQTFKQLTSGEEVEARLPYGQPMILRDYAKLAFNCNELPRDVEHTDGFFRRFLIVPFNVTIPEKERNYDLADEIIKSELPGVFNWVLEGLDRILKNRRFTECVPAEEMVSRFRVESDSVAMFLEEENYVASINNQISLTQLYRDYKTFCADDGYKPLGKRNFKKRLESQNVSVEAGTGNRVFVWIEQKDM